MAESESVSLEGVALMDALITMADAMVKAGLPKEVLAANWRKQASGHLAKGQAKPAAMLELMAVRIEGGLKLLTDPPQGRA